LCEDLKRQNVNISEIPLLNIGKTSNLDIHLLETASSTLDDIYKEAEVLGKHHRTQTLYQKAIGWFYYLVYTIVGLVALYITVKCSLISKCIGVIKFCCVPREGCVQYFYKCFNNNARIRSHPLNDPHVITFSAIPTNENDIYNQPQEITVRDRNITTRNENNRRSRSRNNRLSNLS